MNPRMDPNRTNLNLNQNENLYRFGEQVQNLKNDTGFRRTLVQNYTFYLDSVILYNLQ